MSFIRQSILGFLALLGLIWIGYKISLSAKHQEANAFAKKGLDSLLTNVHWIEFNEQGIISQEFFAPQVIGDALKNCYHIQNPLLKLTQSDEFWEIQSHHADAAQNAETIDLIHKVRIKHTNPQKSMISVMKTEHLKYLPKQKKANTKDKVTINMGENVLHSVGLDASFDDNKKIKLGTVSGHYKPEDKAEG